MLLLSENDLSPNVFEFTRGVAKDMGYQMSIVIVWLKCGGGEKNNAGLLLQGQNHSRKVTFCFECGHERVQSLFCRWPKLNVSL